MEPALILGQQVPDPRGRTKGEAPGSQIMSHKYSILRHTVELPLFWTNPHPVLPHPLPTSKVHTRNYSQTYIYSSDKHLLGSFNLPGIINTAL